MEIKDYLRVLGKRAWLLVMIPAVAGVVAGLIAVGQPQAFRTTATLQLPRTRRPHLHRWPSSSPTSKQPRTTRRSRTRSPLETGVPVRRIQRLRITQVGDSSQLTMSFQDKRKDATDAKAVINGIAASALAYLQTPEVRNSQRGGRRRQRTDRRGPGRHRPGD